MKQYNLLAFGVLFMLLSSCVQKTYKRTLVFMLDVSQVKDIKTVGIRGNDKPLNWENDLEMVPVKEDSLYKIVVSGETGYLFTEVKFTVNHDFELKDQPNRRIVFSHQDTTYYKAVFNKR